MISDKKTARFAAGHRSLNAFDISNGRRCAFPGFEKAGLCYCSKRIVTRTVKSLAPILGGLDRWRSKASAAGFVRTFFLLFFALLACGGISRAENDTPTLNAVLNANSGLAQSAVRSTIDDFDGDYHPDQIAVKTGASEFSGTQYWIDVRLSTAGRQIIPVFSVSGGIQVVARDVNGNGYLDLVLTASVLRRPVAILLNDGHGQFTRVDPDEFPRAFQDAEDSWESRGHFRDDYAGLPRSLRFLIVLTPGRMSIAPSPVARLEPANLGNFLSRALAPHAGRAPPVSSLL